MTIVHYIASPFWGGGEQYVFELAGELLRHGHRLVFVLQPKTDPMVEERFAAMGTIYTLNPKTKNGKFSFVCAIQLARIIHREKASVLHLHALKDLFIGVWAKIFLMGGINLIANHHLVSAAKNKISWRWAYRHVNHYIFVSKAVKHAFLANTKVAQACQTAVVVHNSTNIHPVEFISDDWHKQLHIPANETLFLYHGRICQEKGILQLLMHLDPLFDLPFHIIIAGNIAQEDNATWQTLMQNEGLRKHIIYLGFRTDIAALILQTDCGLLPSIAPESGGPLSLLEHMALASPVISSNNGSQPEFITHQQHGILCAPNDYLQWLTAIQWIIEHPAERKQMGTQAQQHFQKLFNYDLFYQQILHLYANTSTH